MTSSSPSMVMGFLVSVSVDSLSPAISCSTSVSLMRQMPVSRHGNRDLGMEDWRVRLEDMGGVKRRSPSQNISNMLRGNILFIY